MTEHYVEMMITYLLVVGQKGLEEIVAAIAGAA